MFCKDCAYWNKFLNSESGSCSEILNSYKILIHLHLGWDGGYVHEIETEEDFGCVLFKSRD